MTLKESINVRGLRTTVGHAGLEGLSLRARRAGDRTRAAAGAVLMGKTNVPPMLADWQSNNPVYGRTSNPWDLARTPGGSSGGGAAALAAGLTPARVRQRHRRLDPRAGRLLRRLRPPAERDGDAAQRPVPVPAACRTRPSSWASRDRWRARPRISSWRSTSPPGRDRRGRRLAADAAARAPRAARRVPRRRAAADRRGCRSTPRSRRRSTTLAARLGRLGCQVKSVQPDGARRPSPALRALPDAAGRRDAVARVPPEQRRARLRRHAHARRRVEPGLQRGHRERRARLPRLDRAARAGTAPPGARSSASGTCCWRRHSSPPAYPHWDKPWPDTPASIRKTLDVNGQAGARGARPLLSVRGHRGRPAGDGVPGRPHARRPADRAAGDRPVPRGPHARSASPRSSPASSAASRLRRATPRTDRERGSMKISAFHLMPHRELPGRLREALRVGVGDAAVVGAGRRRAGSGSTTTGRSTSCSSPRRPGFDGVCTNEHHQNAYGFMPSPNLMGSVLAKATQRQPTSPSCRWARRCRPPIRRIRVAEEYAMLDCISGGRLVAGLPLGSPMDVNFCYGITPMEHRERYREAFALTLKAWQSREIFAWNGRYFQLAQREPVAAARSSSRTRRCGCRARAASAPSTSPSTTTSATASSATRARRSAKSMMDGYWQVVTDKGQRGESVSRGVPAARGGRARPTRDAEEKYARHVEYFYHKCLHCRAPYVAPPGNQDYRSLVATVANPVRRAEDPKTLRYRDFVEKGYVIAGSPATVRDRLEGRSRQGPARRQSHGAAPDRLDAARADAREHRPLRARGAAGPARHLGRRGLGEPLVAREARAMRRRRSGRRRRGGGPGMTREQTHHRLAGPVRMRVLSEGSGPALVYFHGPWGLTWDPFLDELARDFTVYAPRASGHVAGRARRHLSPRRPLGSRPLLRRAARPRWSSSRRCWSATRSAAWSRASWRRPSPRRVRRLVLIDPHRLLARRRAGRQLDDARPRRDARAGIFRDPDRRGRAAAVRRHRAAGGGGRARAADVGDGHHRQVHLADSRTRD